MFLLSAITTGAGGGERNTGHVDERLIAKIAAGDKGALAELYAQTKTAVFSFALSILRDRHGAEDVMQEVYVRIYAAALGYQQRGKPMAWILTITRNLALMRMRSDKSGAALSDDAWQTPDPHDSSAESIDRLILEKAFSVLSDEERQIVMLHAVSGQKHREIAALLGIPLTTALSKYHRALSKLKDALREDGDE